MPEQLGSGLADSRLASNAARTIEVHIEELVLHGFSFGDRYAIAEALQQELTQLIGRGQLPVSQGNPVAVKQIDAGTFQVKAGSKPETSGAQIAQSVLRGMRREMRVSSVAGAARGAGGRKP